MSSTFKFSKALAVLAVATLALSACGSGADAGKSGPDAGTITYWSMWKVGEPQQKVIAGAIADFEKETGATVKVQWQGRSNVQKLVPALNTNNVPDIVDGPYAKLAPVLGDTGQAHGLADAYAQKVDGKTVSELIPGKYLQVSNIKDKDGQPWMLPYSLSSDGIWFDAAKNPGLAASPPASWDDLVALLDKEKAAGQTPLAADGDIAGYNSMWFTTALIKAEGPGAFAKVAADKTGAAWDAPAVLDAAKKVEQIARGGYLIKGYNASKWPAQQQVWANGGAELLFNGSWIPTETGTYAATDFKYSSFPFPSVAGQPSSARADFVGWAVPAKAKNSATAEKFAAFMLKKKYQDAYGTEAKVLPIRADAATAPEMASIKKALDSAKNIYLQNDGVTAPGYVEKILWPIDDELFLGKITANDFVAKMKAAQIDYWKNNS
ncbi:ABC transporter substrate-binding protein [Arthrobacter sp. ERGS1:01]|uniref:ABC transporter substrate-binding protein n=1 Tax=Arthrobacter sp. ERGS1:01 TaxID=1704044 RepID=UPI0006B5C2AA|nr:ABC transporter substrate-binding protein [Arthrobacter sp. ERGS1:01]ALE04931.1 ABC transporter substrate-binding protein [Arthrobacter sp. ERGS1:01]